MSHQFGDSPFKLPKLPRNPFARRHPKPTTPPKVGKTKVDKNQPKVVTEEDFQLIPLEFDVVVSTIQELDNRRLIRLYENLINAIPRISITKKMQLVEILHKYSITFPEYCNHLGDDEFVEPDPVLEALAPLVLTIRDYVFEQGINSTQSRASIIDALPCSDQEKDKLKALKAQFGDNFGRYCICFANGNESDNIWLAAMAELECLKIYISK